jgi:hypothetical protein
MAHIVLLVTPLVLTGTTYVAFRYLTRWLGQKPGYLAGFLFYWLFWCLVPSWWILGSHGLVQIFQDMRPQFGQPAWLGLLMLIIPLLLGYGYAFPRAVKQANLTIILLSALIALVNGSLEELLWRGAYVSVFPESWFFGLFYPAIGFAVWHFAPQAVFPSRAPGGNLALVVVAGLVGLMWGWVALQSGSILWTTVSHVLFDFSGLGARVYFSS